MKELIKEWKEDLRSKTELLKEMKFDAKQMKEVNETPSLSYLKAIRILESEIELLKKTIKL